MRSVSHETRAYSDLGAVFYMSLSRNRVDQGTYVVRRHMFYYPTARTYFQGDSLGWSRHQLPGAQTVWVKERVNIQKRWTTEGEFFNKGAKGGAGL